MAFPCCNLAVCLIRLKFVQPFSVMFFSWLSCVSILKQPSDLGNEITCSVADYKMQGKGQIYWFWTPVLT